MGGAGEVLCVQGACAVPCFAPGSSEVAVGLFCFFYILSVVRNLPQLLRHTVYVYVCICLHDPDNHNGVITHLEPDILECEVKWALESITTNKASGGDGIPVELFQILKDNAVKVLHSICQQIWKTQQWTQDWKRSIFIPIPKKGYPKECSNYCTIALISHASKVMLKIL